VPERSLTLLMIADEIERLASGGREVEWRPLLGTSLVKGERIPAGSNHR